jgi:hypothetical protein
MRVAVVFKGSEFIFMHCDDTVCVY